MCQQDQEMLQSAHVSDSLLCGIAKPFYGSGHGCKIIMYVMAGRPLHTNV